MVSTCSRSSRSRSRLSRRYLPIVVILAAVAFVYRAAPAGYFFEDDFQWLASRPAFHPLQLFDIDLFDHFYRPVIELYFWAGLPLFGGSPRLFHVANVVLHALNAIVLFMLARLMSGRVRFAFLASLFFAVMPGYVEAIAWVSALAEAVVSLFGCLSIYWWLRFRGSGRVTHAALAAVCFGLALLSHESAVVLLAIIGLADLAFATAWREMHSLRGWTRLVRDYAPFLVLAAGYLAIDLTINSRSYLVDEGHYRFGSHAIRNVFEYIVSLYVGKRNLASFGAIALVVVLLLVRGTPRVRFAIGWMLFGILPFAFFTFGVTSRYQYLAAMGFALLLADGVEWLDRVLTTRLADRTRRAVVSLAAAAIAIRFMVFASEGVENFTKRTEWWRGMGERIRAEHAGVPRGGEVAISRALAEQHGFLYLEALVRWELKDPSIRVVLR